MSIKLANNAVSVLALAISNSSTTVQLRSGDGARFPALAFGQWYPITVVSTDGDIEIMRVVGRSGDTLTVERSQEGTASRSFPSGSPIELRITAGIFEALTASAAEMANLLPPGAGPIPWSLPSEPAGWIFANGRVLTEDSPYQKLRSAYIAAGFPHGSDGSGNPKIPDCRGRVVAGLDNGAGILTGGTLGAALGEQAHTLIEGEMPEHNHAASTASSGSHSHTATAASAGAHAHTGSTSSAGSHQHNQRVRSETMSNPELTMNTMPLYEYRPQNAGLTSSAGEHTHSITINSGGAHSHTVTVNSAGDHTHSVTVSNKGGGQAHNNVQPTLVTNMIVKT